MRRPEEVKRELVRGWLEKADRDLGAHRHLLAAAGAFTESVAFHAQQAAEKYIKAFLICHKIEFPKTHDLARLLELMETRDPELAAALAGAADLTPYGVEYRYPGDYPAVSLAEAERSVDLAEEVRREVRRRLPQDVLP